MKFVRIERSALPSKQTWTDKLMITFKTALPLKCGSLWLYFLVQICKFCNFSLFKKYFVVLPPSDCHGPLDQMSEFFKTQKHSYRNNQNIYTQPYISKWGKRFKVSKFQRQIFSFEPKTVELIFFYHKDLKWAK